ncbi:MAG: D-glycerate dehydrogenase [Planctomycetota bacterium]
MTADANTKPVVIVTRDVPGKLDVPGVPGAIVHQLGPDHASRDALLRAASEADVLISMFPDRIDAEVLDAGSGRLRGVCNFAVGFNNIDTKACAERDIVVTNTPDAVTEGTANLAWLLAMAVARRLVEGDRYARTGAWAQNGPLAMGDFLGMDLTGRTILIVGAGRIGYATAHRALAWGMKVLYVSRSQKWAFELAPMAARKVDLHEGLAEADVVSVHTPLTPETTHLIGEPELGRMKPTAIIVNTSRGPVIDEEALVEALRNKRIWGAGLDVFENEPRVHPGLVELDNVTMMPHVGSAEKRYRERMTAMVGENAAAILLGRRPPNVVEA